MFAPSFSRATIKDLAPDILSIIFITKEFAVVYSRRSTSSKIPEMLAEPPNFILVL